MHEIGEEGGLVSCKFIERTVVPELNKEGFAVPATRSLSAALSAGVGPLPEIKMKHGRHLKVMSSFVHLLNMLWCPLLAYIGCLGGAQEAPPLTETINVNREALGLEMVGIVDSPDEVITVDEWVELIARTLQRLVGVSVPTKLILAVVTPLVPFDLTCTPANAMHLLRSSHCSRLVGTTLAEQVSRLLLAEIAELPVELLSTQELARKLKEEVVATMVKTYCEEPEDEAAGRPVAKKLRRTQKIVDENLGNKTQQVLFMLRNRIAATRVHDTILGASELLRYLGPSSSRSAPPPVVDDLLVDRQTIMRHLLLLDGAVDRATKERIMDLKESGRFAGVALATDESPPSQPRFRGLRFQISVFYYGKFTPVPDWEIATEPPLHVTTCLADIIHCPGKKGVDVHRILDKQLERLGLSSFDVVSCTGDGGGENEGGSGVHSQFEYQNPGYARRRCLPHIAWRTCDQAIQAASLDYKSLASYMVEGVTWSRLSSLAQQPVDKGGLGYRDGSRQLKDPWWWWCYGMGGGG